jgi:hypothetical protein
MALIPTDVGINLRTQVDSPLRPTAPPAEIPSDLPDLRQGQVFSARILEVLPEQTYKALVAGKSLTLSLPSGAKTGDSLELVVVDKTPQGITARLAADSAEAPPGQPYPHATLSPAAQLIARLLPAQGEQARPIVLNQGEPLLATPPNAEGVTTSQLAQQLEKAIGQSGMFYEAHQAKWVAGQIPTSELLAEPQNQAAHTPHSAEASAQGSRQQTLLGWLGGEKAPIAENPTTNTPNTPATHPSAQHTLPEELRNIVQQQLDAAATQRMIWHGEVWPNQPMDWEIQRDEPERQAAGEDLKDNWTTRLALTTPRLGRVEATLELRRTGVHISILAPADTSVEELRQSLPQLGNSLTAAGVLPLSLRVRRAD